MKRFLGFLAIFALAGVSFAWSGLTPAQEQDKVELNRSKFMRAKVEHSKQIVEGLAMENYDAIAQNAQDLMLLMNESMWNAFQTPEYVAMSGEFKAAAEHLREAAHNKNVDGATLAYFEVTLTCVRCHKYVRRWGQNPK